MTTSDRKSFEAAIRALEVKLAEYRARVVACETVVKLLTEELDGGGSEKNLEDAPLKKARSKRGVAAVDYDAAKAQLGLASSSASEAAADEPAPRINSVTGTVDNSNATPLSDEAIAIGKSLGQPFTVTDLKSRLDGDDKRPYNFIAAWKRKAWIETAGFGQYRRTKEFGE